MHTVLFLLGALLVGVLSAVQVNLALGLVVLGLGAVLSRFSSRDLIAATVILILAVPTGWSMATALPFTSISIGGSTISIQMLLAILALCVYLVGSPALREGATETTQVRFPFLTTAVLVWLTVVAISLVSGVLHNGLKAALSDGQVYLLYGCILVPLVGERRLGDTSAKRIAGTALVGLAAYGVWVMSVLFSDGLHRAVFAGANMARTRVGFGTTSLLVMFMPLTLALLETPSLRKHMRLILVMTLGIMGLTIMASQSRAALAALLAALAVYLLWPGRRRVGSRGRAAAVVAVVLVAFIGFGVVLANPDLSSTAANFIGRGPLAVTDATYQVRAATNALLLSRVTEGGVWLRGLGLGSTALTVAPSGVTAYTAFFVDNAFLTVALKAGIFGVLSLAAVIVAVWAVALRLAGMGSPLARAIASALPFFVAVVGLSTAHLVNAASIPVGLAVVTAILAAEGTRLSARGAPEQAPDTRVQSLGAQSETSAENSRAIK